MTRLFQAPGRRGKKGPTVHDDDFYKSLAANVGDSMSDVSDADPTQMLQGMDVSFLNGRTV